jgi:epoxyqueuosine reductase
VCPWNERFAAPRREPAFGARAFLDGKDAMTLAAEILAMDEETYRAAFRGSAMKRAKLAGLHRTARVALARRHG